MIFLDYNVFCKLREVGFSLYRKTNQRVKMDMCDNMVNIVSEGIHYSGTADSLSSLMKWRKSGGYFPCAKTENKHATILSLYVGNFKNKDEDVVFNAKFIMKNGKRYLRLFCDSIVINNPTLEVMGEVADSVELITKDFTPDANGFVNLVFLHFDFDVEDQLDAIRDKWHYYVSGDFIKEDVTLKERFF